MLKELCKKYGAHKGEDKLSRYYIEAYETYFGPRREEKLRLLEIGVQSGGSLRMWKEYFPNAEIVGVDINKNCLKHEDLDIIIGDQTGEKFLSGLGEFDIIIDDGSHKMFDQQFTFKAMWNKLRANGIYVIEDLETSYWPQFGGGYKRDKTTINYLHSLINRLNYLAINHQRAGKYRRTIGGIRMKSISFYPSICFIQKELI